jgi:hypothetical protein
MDASVDVAWRGGIVAARSVKKASRNAARSLAAMQRNAARAHSSLPFSWRETGVRQDHRVIAIGGFRAWPLNQSARYN